MVRLYSPEVKTEYYDTGIGVFDGHCAVMVESADGEWVMLETYNDEMARKDKEIAKLLRSLKAAEKIIESQRNHIEWNKA